MAKKCVSLDTNTAFNISLWYTPGRLVTAGLKCRCGVEFPSTSGALKIPAQLMFFRVLKCLLCILHISSFGYRSFNNVGWLELGVA